MPKKLNWIFVNKLKSEIPSYSRKPTIMKLIVTYARMEKLIKWS